MMQRRRRKSTSVIPGDLGYFNNHIDYYKKMKKLLDAKQTQVDLIAHRRKAIQDGNVVNYQNEFNRIQGMLAKQNEGLRGNSLQRLLNRQVELEMLGAKAVDGIKD